MKHPKRDEQLPLKPVGFALAFAAMRDKDVTGMFAALPGVLSEARCFWSQWPPVQP